MSPFDGFYEEPLAAYLAAHGIAPDAAWRTAAREQGLELRPLKRARLVPRIQAVIARVRSLAPGLLLDIGSGRGSFLWPAHQALPATRFVALEASQERCAFFGSLQRGGLGRVRALRGDACRLPVASHSIQVTTLLEVLEHLRDPLAAARELARVTHDSALVTVPMRADDNAEHLRVYNTESLRTLLRDAGFARVVVEPLDGALLGWARPER